MRKDKDLIPKISAHVQFETVSPATKLLEKRRKMYEVDEAFEVQKEEHKKYMRNKVDNNKLSNQLNKILGKEIYRFKSTW